MARTRKPLKIESGNARVVIYHHKNFQKHQRRSYDQFRIAYQQHGARKFETRSSLKAAQKRAAEILLTINNGQLNLLQMTQADSSAYFASIEHVAPTGVPLATAAMKFAAADKILKDAGITDVDIIAAAEYLAQHRKRQIITKTVNQVVEELLDAKDKAGVSERYLDDLDQRCNKFADYFENKPMIAFTAADVRRFLTLKIFGTDKNETLGPRSTNNFIGALRTLFRFAKSRDYLPQEYRELERVDLVKDKGGDIEIYTPQEMADLLAHAQDDDVLYLALCGFAGIRTEEFIRLDWKEVKWASGVIEITAAKAKTASRRLVPITDNLRAWVEPIAKRRGNRGPVWPHVRAYLHCRMYKLKKGKARGLFVRAGVARKPNALRHSYISYRVAETKNVAEVALEAGNSPKMIFSNYRELVTDEDAKAWFAIMPAATATAGNKVVAMK